MAIALLIGDVHAGKTTTCLRIAELVRARGVSVGGIVSPAVYDGDHCVGYDVVDLATGQAARLASIDAPGVEQVGRFHFSAEGLARGRAALEQARERGERLIIVDEVGRLELNGGGWAAQVDRLGAGDCLTLLAVRRPFAARVEKRWQASPSLRFDLMHGLEAITARILAVVEAG